MKLIANKAEYTQDQWEAMSAWFATPMGLDLLEKERALITDMLKRRFGYHLLHLGCSDRLLHDLSPMGHKFSMCPFPNTSTQHTAIARGESIPLPSESVDLVLLHHALDFTQNQHQFLREVSRVLIAGGAIVIIGFNPWSTWGLRNRFHWRKQQRSPWNASMLSTQRISDWLKLLEFQVDQVRYGEYALPVNSERLIRYSSFMEPVASRLNWPSGGTYAILARKQVIPLTPIQKKWRPMPIPKIGLQVADKVSVNQHNNKQDS